LAICDNDYNLWFLLSQDPSTTGITEEDVPQYCDYSKTPIAMPQANYVTVDVAIVEESTGSTVRAWAIVKIIPGSTTDSPYLSQTQNLPAFDDTNHSVQIPGSTAYPAIPLVTSKNWQAQPN
jgi:hypothetical protein